jgi:hypothetical protein
VDHYPANILVRARTAPSLMLPEVISQIRSVDERLIPYDAMALSDSQAEISRPLHARAVLLFVIAGLGLLRALLAVYGLSVASVADRAQARVSTWPDGADRLPALVGCRAAVSTAAGALLALVAALTLSRTLHLPNGVSVPHPSLAWAGLSIVLLLSASYASTVLAMCTIRRALADSPQPKPTPPRAAWW